MAMKVFLVWFWLVLTGFTLGCDRGDGRVVNDSNGISAEEYGELIAAEDSENS